MHRLIALRTAHCTQLSSQFSHTHPVTLTVPGVNWSAMSLHLLYLFYKLHLLVAGIPWMECYYTVIASQHGRCVFTASAPSLHHHLAAVPSPPPCLFTTTVAESPSPSQLQQPPSADILAPSPPQSPPVSPPWVLPPLWPLPNRRHLFTRRCLFIATCHPLFCTAQRLFFCTAGPSRHRRHLITSTTFITISSPPSSRPSRPSLHCHLYAAVASLL